MGAFVTLRDVGKGARMKGEWVKHGSSTAPVVVFVHGVLSNGESCWQHASGAYWPDIVANDPDMSDLGVYVFTYRSGFFSGSYSLADAVDALKEHLTLDGISGSTGIVFVCHSMGGIVVRKYLVSRATDLIARNAQIAIFLLASPSLGSDYADWCKPLAKLLGHSQSDALRFVRSNAWLTELDREFINLKEQRRLSIAGKELIEDHFITLRWLWRKQVVEPFSGARYFGEPYKVPESDHFSIAKIESGLAIQHRQLKYFIAEWRRTKLESIKSSERIEQSSINIADQSDALSPAILCNRSSGDIQEQNPDVRLSQTQLPSLEETTAPTLHTNSEAAMDDPTTKHFIDRFWDLDASDRRDITLELGLISEEEIDLPEPQRYDTAVMRASKRNLLDRLEQLVKERE